MTIKISKTNIPPVNFVGGMSRYLNQDVIYYSENNLLTFTTYKRKKITRSDKDQVMLITPGYEFRPDLLAYDKYGVVDVWWKILEANKMKDIYEFRSGKTIFLPENIFFA